jgi:tRNA pseudouridine38-40 synthase
MTNLRLLVAYDGAKFAGFQVQPDQRTVQGVLEDALSEVAGDHIRVRAAGRTDAGVHALGQVVSFDDQSLASAKNASAMAEVIVRAMPSLLPHDVAVLDAQWAPEAFDARRSARARSYVYLLWCHDTPHPLYRSYSTWMRDEVDSRRLHEALQKVVGTHDFTSFGRLRPDQDPVRTVMEASVVTDSPFIRIRVVGRSFLHQMVRSIVGSALEVAVGRREPSWMAEALDARDRAAAGAVAAPEGLTLVDVSYDGVVWPRRPAIAWPWSDLCLTTDTRGCA